MGKKITIDSATMMNKVFEVIEAKKIFNVNYNKISIITHPNSYVHAIIKFRNGLIKIIAHETNMKIPIFNTLYSEVKNIKVPSKKIDFQKLNNLDFKSVDKSKFPIVNLLNILPERCSLFETIVVASNDELVNAFLNEKIKFTDISTKMINFIKKREFKKFKFIQPKKIQDIVELSKYVRSKINSKSI